MLVLLLPFARSALRPILAPFLVYFLLSALALPLGLLYFSDTYQNVWFYLHRGRGGGRFLEQGILDNPHPVLAVAQMQARFPLQKRPYQFISAHNSSCRCEARLQPGAQECLALAGSLAVFGLLRVGNLLRGLGKKGQGDRWEIKRSGDAECQQPLNSGTLLTQFPQDHARTTTCACVCVTISPLMLLICVRIAEGFD